ncbi:MAG: hypothetical protein ABI637_10215 [Gemmatimonadota bacterium]
MRFELNLRKADGRVPQAASHEKLCDEPSHLWVIGQIVVRATDDSDQSAVPKAAQHVHDADRIGNTSRLMHHVTSRAFPLRDLPSGTDAARRVHGTSGRCYKNRPKQHRRRSAIARRFDCKFIAASGYG